MTQRNSYRARLRSLADWEPFLLRESGLPGPRANLELAHAVAEEASEELLLRFAAVSPDEAPGGAAREYLPVCGAIGLGRLIAEGRRDLVALLRGLASDPRWRVREGVAMGLQRWGDADLPDVTREMQRWIRGGPLEQRAAIAGLCEPRLLSSTQQARKVLDLLDHATASFQHAENPSKGGWDVLGKGLAYAWSVAVAASPEIGKRRMERWMRSPDPGIRRAMRVNLTKNRLVRLDPVWVERWSAALRAPARGGRAAPKGKLGSASAKDPAPRVRRRSHK